MLDLTTFTVIADIPVFLGIESAIFLDSANRFILMETGHGLMVYDMNNAHLYSIQGTFNNQILKPDQTAVMFFSIGTTSIQTYGVNITEGQVTLASYPSPQLIFDSSISNVNDIDPSQFYLTMDYNSLQEKAL